MTNLLTAASLVFLTASAPAPAPSRSTPQPQAEAPAQPQTPAQSQDQPDAPSDRRVDPSQPDFTIIGLPTTLKIPRFASAFRVTHRFGRPLGAGDFGDLASDFFGFDSGAQIGLEYRFGIMAGTQIGIHRTSNQTIEFFAQQHVLGQDRSPVGLDIIGTAEGTENFTESYSPAIGAVISRTLGRHGALYAHPIWVNNTNEQPSTSRMRTTTRSSSDWAGACGSGRRCTWSAKSFRDSAIRRTRSTRASASRSAQEVTAFN